MMSPDSSSLDYLYKEEPPSKKKRDRGIKKPLRNSSAFILYSKDIRKILISEKGPSINPNDLLVKIGQLWKTLDSNEREIYAERAKEDKIRYLRELKEFYEKFPCEKHGNKTKNNHIKRPCTAYALFLAENKKLMKEEDPKLRMVDIVKISAQKWKNLSEKEKEVYQNQAKIDKQNKSQQFVQFALDQNAHHKSHKTAIRRRNRKIENASKALRDLGVEDAISDENNNIDKLFDFKLSSAQRLKKNDMIQNEVSDTSKEDSIEQIPKKKLCVQKQEEKDSSEEVDIHKNQVKKTKNFLEDLMSFKLGHR